MTRPITFALSKGRLSELALERLRCAGVECGSPSKRTRKLFFEDEEGLCKFFLAKASDVPTYVEHGAADLGIAGKDTILEGQKSVCEVLDLDFGHCRMVVAGLPGALNREGALRVASKYPHIARDYFFNKRKRTAEIIKLHGSVELAPIVGLADVIVDIVETGATLKANGLVILDEVAELSARLIVNRVSMKTERERVADIIRRLRACPH
ncbi:MAG: ATP phosphoribosyltransferase [Clostridiales bacterium]|jgi:ATP phosphoribosyltransferase|nr:ATP phosphoribosyltransferase [Clostridiales bacterium]